MSVFVAPGTDNEVPGVKMVVPVCSMDERGRLHIEGSGFFIGNGLVATAKHVVIPRGDTIPFTPSQLFVVHMVDPDVPSGFVRPVQARFVHPSADVALLHLAGLRNEKTGELVRNMNLILTTRDPVAGERVATFAYPGSIEVEKEVVGTIDHQLHFAVGWYEGEHRQYHPNGFGLSPSHGCFESSVDLHGLASGGPALDSRGRVYGVNSSSMRGAYSLICPTRHMLDIVVTNMPLNGCVVKPSMTLQEIADLGCLALDV